jgi:hypothetical protein
MGHKRGNRKNWCLNQHRVSLYSADYLTFRAPRFLPQEILCGERAIDSLPTESG